MPIRILERSQRVPRPLGEVFDFFARPGNLARITPPWLAFRLTSWEPAGEATRDGGAGVEAGRREGPVMAPGLRLHYRIRPLGFPQRWTSRISEWDPPHRFVDEQERGPYRHWRHEHTFLAQAGGTEIRDRVEYELPLGPLGRLAHLLLVRRQLESIFEYRRRRVAQIFGVERRMEVP